MLTRELGLTKRLSATLLFDFPSINALADHLLGVVFDTPALALAPVSPTPVVRATPIAVDESEIAAMTDEEAEALLLEELG